MAAGGTVHALFTIICKPYILPIDDIMYKMYKAAPDAGDPFRRTRTETAISKRKAEMQGEHKTEKTYAATEARSKFADVFDEAYYGARVFITKRDRQVALVSVSFLERVDKLLEMEAAIEAEAAKAALEEFQSKGGKTMEQIEQELDME